MSFSVFPNFQSISNEQEFWQERFLEVYFRIFLINQSVFSKTEIFAWEQLCRKVVVGELSI